jgi:hypothetical protein
LLHHEAIKRRTGTAFKTRQHAGVAAIDERKNMTHTVTHASEGSNEYVFWFDAKLLTTNRPVMPQFGRDTLDDLASDPTAHGTITAALGKAIVETFAKFKAVTNVSVTYKEIQVAFSLELSKADADANAAEVNTYFESLSDAIKAE